MAQRMRLSVAAAAFAAAFRIVAIAVAAGFAVLAAPAFAVAQQAPTVLFLCPHGAAKSVLASAYFRQLAAAEGIRVQTDAAGVEPGPEVSAAVAARLKQQGMEVPIAKPRLVTDADVARADIIVSIGCDLTNAPASVASSKKLRRWDEVPDIGKDFAGSDKAIREKARALVEEIKQQARSQRQPQR